MASLAGLAWFFRVAAAGRVFFLPPRFWVCSGFSGFVSEVADLGLRVGFWDGGLGFSGMVDSGLVSGMLDFGSLGSLTRGWSLGWLTGFQG